MTYVSIVIPVHNEARNIGLLCNEIRHQKLDFPYEIIVVDDGSTDETYTNVSKLKMTIPELKIIQHERNYGQSAALATGIAHADGKIIVTMDGDGQNDPADIPNLISALLESDNSRLRMVIGFRKRRNDSLWRIISSKIANSVRSFILKDHTPDTGAGLKVFYKSTFMRLPFFDHMHRFLPALIQGQGGDVLSVEVTHRPRKYGKSHYGTLNRLWAGIVDMMGVAFLRLRWKDIKIRRNE